MHLFLMMHLVQNMWTVLLSEWEIIFINFIEA